MRTIPTPETALVIGPLWCLGFAFMARRRAQLVLNRSQRRELRAHHLVGGLFLVVVLPLQVVVTKGLVASDSYPALLGATGDVLLVVAVALYVASTYRTMMIDRGWRGSADLLAVVAGLAALAAAGVAKGVAEVSATRALILAVLSFAISVAAGHLGWPD